MDRQLAFNDAVAGIWSQQDLSRKRPHGPCRYRGANNTRCAVGWLIPDENYVPEIEGSVDREVIDAIDPKYGPIVEYDDGFFLMRMQEDIHDVFDEWDPGKFKSAVIKFATDWNLEVQIDMEC